MILITGATGKLGQHVTEQLLAKAPANSIALAVRDPKKAADLAARGVHVRQADYTKPDTWTHAFEGVKQVLLISSSEVGQRAKQHQAVIDAAVHAKVQLLAYTSILHCDSSKMGLAGEHQQTEAALRASKLPFVMLRNGWYTENYNGSIQPALDHGVIMGCAGDGRIAAASRADYAAAAVAVLTTPGHANKIYELAGDVPFTMAEYAAELSRQSHKPVAYKNMPAAAYKEALLGMGLPEHYAALLADSDDWASRGALHDSSGDLHRLIGRATTPLKDTVAAALRK